MVMELFLKLLAVFGLAAVELWAAVPAGFVLKLNPFVIAVTTALGAIVGALAVLVVGDRVREQFARFREAKRFVRVQQLWDSYGVIGLGLLAPLLTGAPLGVAVGLILGATARRLFFWVSVGIVLWAIGLTVAGVLGLAGIRALSN